MKDMRGATYSSAQINEEQCDVCDDDENENGDDDDDEPMMKVMMMKREDPTSKKMHKIRYKMMRMRCG